MLIDTVTIAGMALLFAATLITSIAAWRRNRSPTPLARGILATLGLSAYLIVLFDVDLGVDPRWMLRGLLAAYVLPELLLNLDILRNNFYG